MLPTRSTDRVAHLSQAHRALEDVAYLVEKYGVVDDVKMRAYLVEEVDRGLLAVAELAGRDRAEMERTVESLRKQDEQLRAATAEDAPDAGEPS